MWRPVVVAGLAGLAACSDGGEHFEPSVPERELKIVALNPSNFYVEGGARVTMKTENGCGKPLATISIDEAVVDYEAPDLNTYVFSAPPHLAPEPCGGGRSQVKVSMTCASPPDTSFRYRRNVAEVVITYEPDAEPAATIKTYAPAGLTVPGDVARVVVTFTRALDPATVTSDTFGIAGISGQISASSDAKTFTFTPDEPLAAGQSFTAFVGDVKSRACGKTLRHTVGTNPARDEWSFSTFGAEWSRPAVVERAPMAETAGTDATCVARFDQPMRADAFEGAFWMGDSIEAPVPGSIAYDPETQTATYTPSAPLTAGQEYKCIVRGAEDPYAFEIEAAVRTTAGAWMREDVRWSFRVP